MLPVLPYASDNKGMLTAPSSDLSEEALLVHNFINTITYKNLTAEHAEYAEKL